MQKLNRYLAISHILSVLTEKQTVSTFHNLVKNNPLFLNTCFSPGKFLFFLKAEQLVNDNQKTFLLSDWGRELYQHILGWTQRNHAEIEKKISAYRIITPLKAPIQCPACQSKYCALNIFSILIERMREGISEWNNWDLESLSLISQFLNMRYQNHQLKLLIHGETQIPQDLVWLNKVKLARTIARTLPNSDSDLIRRFLFAFGQRRLLRSLPGLRFPHEFISRLRLDHGLYDSLKLKTLRTLSSPDFYGEIYAPWKPSNEVKYLYFSGVGMNPQKSEALLHFGEGHHFELLAFQRSNSKPIWQCEKRIPYNIHEAIN